MTKIEKTEYKRFAKQGCNEHGIRVNIKDMVLLETASGSGRLHFVGNRKLYISYVMFEDSKTGIQYQVFYGANYYDDTTKSLYLVMEYVQHK